MFVANQHFTCANQAIPPHQHQRLMKHMHLHLGQQQGQEQLQSLQVAFLSVYLLCDRVNVGKPELSKSEQIILNMGLVALQALLFVSCSQLGA